LLLQPARAGRIVRIFVQEKQTVSKDMPLLQLDDRLVRLQEEEAEVGVEAAQLQVTKARDGLKQYQAKKAQAEAALQVAQSKVWVAQRALTHREELFGKELVGQFQVDVGRAQLDEARDFEKVEQNRLIELKSVEPELEVNLAQLQWKRSQVRLETARQEREQYLLQAPVDGLVMRVQAHEGDLVGPTAPRPAIWLAPAGALIVRAQISQEFAGQVSAGQAVQVEDEASASLLARGAIAELAEWFLPRSQFSALPTSINTDLTLECLIDLEKEHAQLRLGQRVRVRILGD